MRTVPWWGVVSAAAAPVLLTGGWTVAADLQPAPFDAVTRSISSLAAQGMPYRWLITIVLLCVGGCDIITSAALRPAALAGRALLAAGGACGMLVAANPQPPHGSSPLHVIFTTAGIVLLTLWPAAAISRAPAAPLGLRPRLACPAALVTLALAVWFGAEVISGGGQLGLAERALTAAQAFWPLAVVLTAVGVPGHARGRAG